MNSKKLHKVFSSVCKDWDKYMAGEMGVSAYGADCSNGCQFFIDNVGGIGDWGVCTNKESPRAGLLTWEHQGCEHFKKEKP